MLSIATVVRTTSSHVFVSCPYCYTMHKHGAAAVVVQSHCEPPRKRAEYLISPAPRE